MTDGNVVVAETMAIVQYIITRYPGESLAVAADAPDYAAFLFWYHFPNGSVMPAVMALHDGADGGGAQARVLRYLDLYERHLAHNGP